METSLENEMEISGRFSMGRDKDQQFLITWHDLLIEERQGGQSQRRREKGAKNNPTSLRCQSTDCLMLTEVGGPSSMWAARGSFPGFVFFFPAFPTLKEQQNLVSTPWLFSLWPRSMAKELAGTKEAQEREAVDNIGTVTMKKWFKSGEDKLAWLHADWHFGDQDKSTTHRQLRGSVVVEAQVSTYGSFSGEYLILEDGRLLAATIDGSTALDVEIEGKKMQSKMPIQATVLLVEDCP